MQTESFNQHQVLDVLRVCARQLLIAVDFSSDSSLYVVFERVAEACECLYAMNTVTQLNTVH